MLDQEFTSRWKSSGAAERANYQLFLSELCHHLEVPRPNPAVGNVRRDQYVFERPVTSRHPNGLSSPGFIDLYKRGCFVLEAKQGSPITETTTLFAVPRRRGAGIRGSSGWDEAMMRARNQAEQYAKALPGEEGWPPFLIIVDVGYSLVRKKIGQLRSPQPLLECWLSITINPVQLENILRGIQTNDTRYRHRSPLPSTLSKPFQRPSPYNQVTNPDMKRRSGRFGH